MLAPSGEQIMLARDGYSAVVTEIGATLRSFRAGGGPVVWEFPEEEMTSGGRGQVLAPWPNRLEDGKYRYSGTLGTAALDEPERSNAIHGLVRWMPWSVEERSGERAMLSWVIHPQPAYPFRVRLELAYSLVPEGLEVGCRATNEGLRTAPFGLGFHPYLFGGPDGIDGARIALAAERRLVLDARGLPTGEVPVPGSPLDLAGRTLEGLSLDDCYTGIATGGDGRWRARLETTGGRAELWADAAFAYAMCFTGDSLADPAERRRAVAIEPMTCPPNALRTGVGLIELAQGQSWEANWGISAPRP